MFNRKSKWHINSSKVELLYFCLAYNLFEIIYVYVLFLLLSLATCIVYFLFCLVCCFFFILLIKCFFFVFLISSKIGKLTGPKRSATTNSTPNYRSTSPEIEVVQETTRATPPVPAKTNTTPRAPTKVWVVMVS